MGDRGKRICLGANIYQDRYGITVLVTKGSGADRLSESARFPVGTPLRALKQTRHDLIETLRGRAVEAAPQTGLLAAHIAGYLATFVAGNKRRRDEASLLQHWLDAGFGTRHPESVTALELRQQMAQFAAMTVDGHLRFKPATLNHLRRVLGAVYTAINGRSGINPLRDVPKVTVRYEEPRAIPYDFVELILGCIPDLGRAVKGQDRSTINLTKIRLRVMAYTGLPPAQIGRLQPRDLHLRAKEVYGRPRRKGAGVEGYRLALTDEGVRELTVFQRVHAFGPFSARSVAYVWRRAVIKARDAWLEAHPRQPWPLADDVRAYDLRHSFGTRVYEKTGDLQATADILMHSSLSTTRRYTKGAVAARMKQAAAAF